MKYLAYFQPSPELATLIQTQDCIIIPSSGLHTTLCTFHMEQNQESILISNLSKIPLSAFEVETQTIALFDKESLVLKLTRPPELYQLHQDITEIVRTHATPEFNQRYQTYFGPKYNPHITISKSYTDFNTSTPLLSGHTFRVENFYLAKKVEEKWIEISNFTP